MGELYDSVKTNLEVAFKEIYGDWAKEKGNQSKNPNDIAKTFPIEIVSYDDVFDILHECEILKAHAHLGCFFKYAPSTVARDTRRITRKVFSDFKEIVCWNGEIYERDTIGWVERKVLQDIRGKWHLWNGQYNIEVRDGRSIIIIPPKPTLKIYPIEQP